jgi:predicted RNA-binding protein with PIN domain
MPYWFDGNNLMGQSAAAARKDRSTRREFLSALRDYRKSGSGRFFVFFDGDDPGLSAAPPGVSVRYSAPESADAVIIRRLREIQRPSEVIVVTNDHELSTRCRAEGAKTLNWQQFSSKKQSRITAVSRGTPPQRTEDHDPVDVDEWLNYFGLDEPEDT